MTSMYRIAVAASDGLAALNVFIETRFQLAEEVEKTDPAAAAEMRETWTHVWSTLADAPARALHVELHETPVPTPDLVRALVPVA